MQCVVYIPVYMQLAIYSPADRLQPHRYKADESYEISGPEMTPVQSYLDVEAIIALAKQQSVDAIHPGYGFLSENFTFARRCAEEGVVFIGPTAKTIEVQTMVPTVCWFCQTCLQDAVKIDLKYRAWAVM